MAQTQSVLEQAPSYLLMLNLQSVELSDEQFYRLCGDNPELRIELTAQKELIIMSPTGSKTGWRGGRIFQRLANWAEADGTGLAFDSSTGFTLPNGAKRSPDAAWVRRERWDALTEEQQDEFAPLCPDFVVELRSRTDSLAMLQEKMEEYIENGARLGWLFDPKSRQVYVYRPGQPVECLDDPAEVRGDPVLPGFVFNPREIW
jgi:Uma2 family endonuclease